MTGDSADLSFVVAASDLLLLGISQASHKMRIYVATSSITEFNDGAFRGGCHGCKRMFVPL